MARKITDRLASTKLGRVFFEPDEVGPSSSVQEEQSVAPVAQARSVAPAAFGSGAVASVASSSFTTSFVSSNSNADPEVRAKIQAIADGADQVSYTKFRKLVKNMSSASSDEASCYRMAFAAGKEFNLPAPEVLRGLDVILNDLSQMERKFNEAAPQRIAAKVGARREKIGQIKLAVSEKSEEMQRLQGQLNRLNMEIGQLSQAEQAEQSAISQDEQTVRDDVEKFSVAFAVVRAPYIAERQKIELYGKGA